MCAFIVVGWLVLMKVAEVSMVPQHKVTRWKWLLPVPIKMHQTCNKLPDAFQAGPKIKDLKIKLN